MHRPFLLAVLILVPCAVQAQPEPSRNRFLHWMYGDAFALVQEAGPRTPLYLLGAAAVLVPVSQFDEAINPEVRQRYRGGFATYLDFVNEMGGPRVTLPVASIFAVSLVTDDVRLQDAAFTSLQSLVYAGGISYGLKYTFGRMRPRDAADAFRFVPFSGNTSFPSGHTTTAFAVLTPWVLYYPNAATYGLFAVSTGTALARLARDKHWATDVLAGGTIGFLTAYWLTKQHQNRTAARRLSITPAAGPDALTLTLQVRW